MLNNSRPGGIKKERKVDLRSQRQIIEDRKKLFQKVREPFRQELIEVRENILDELDCSFLDITDKDMEVLSLELCENTKINRIDLRFNKIGIRGVELLFEQCLATKNTTLQTLLMWNNRITYDGCDPIYRCLKTNTTLITLDLSENRLGNDGFFKLIKALEINTTLKNLILWSNGITSAGIEIFVRFLKTEYTEKGFTNLDCVDLQYNNIGGVGDKLLANMVHDTIDIYNSLVKLRSAYQAPKTNLSLTWSSVSLDEGLEDGSGNVVGTGTEEDILKIDPSQIIKNRVHPGVQYHGESFKAHRLLNNVSFTTDTNKVIIPGDSDPNMIYRVIMSKPEDNHRYIPISYHNQTGSYSEKGEYFFKYKK